MSIQSSINNMLSLTGLIAASTAGRREQQAEAKKVKKTKEALQGPESLESTLRSTAEPPTEAGETQAAVATEVRDIDLAMTRSSGLPYSRERARLFEEEFGMTRAEFATTSRQRLRRDLARGMSREDRIRSADLRRRASQGDYSAIEALEAEFPQGGTTDGQE